MPELADVRVGEAPTLGLAQQLGRDDDRLKLLLEIDDVLDLVQEEHVDARDGADAGVIHAVPHQLCDGVQAIVGALLDVGEQLVGRHVLAVKLGHVQMRMANLERANRFEQAFLHRAAHAHHLAGRLHLRGEAIGGQRKLVKREARQLGDYIVQGRLKARRRIRQHDLVQVHTHGDLG